ncbi:hypothetical protein CEXT_79791 [Caerostris extrusa]|uniref:Uncharacterized protein n=1 Tax=Caerostris extrusa TaxID=172846 RepID=A0AAV4TCR7_CAEEX|nr:hypothetical protein CEXT_79791 [Caerostris extrusa]
MLCMETDDIEGNGPFQVYSEVPSEPASPTSPEMLSNLRKKDIARSLLDTFNATTFGHPLHEADHVKLKTLEQDLINALREVGNLELCPLIDCKKHKANVNNSSVNLKRSASHITTVNDDNADGFQNPQKLTAKVNFTKISPNTIETKNLYDKLNIDEQEEPTELCGSRLLGLKLVISTLKIKNAHVGISADED